MRHPALRPPGWRWPFRFVQNTKYIRRGGIYCARRRVSEANRRAAAALRPEIPPAGPCSAANRADMESAPTKVCYNAGAAVSRSARCHPPPVCRGGPWPSRGPCGDAGFPGRCKHRPLQGLRQREVGIFPPGRSPLFRPGVCRYAKRRTSLCGRPVFLQQLETPVILRAFPGAYSSKSRQLRTAV